MADRRNLRTRHRLQLSGRALAYRDQKQPDQSDHWGIASMSYGVLPLPPLDATVSDTASTTVTIVMAAMALGALAFSLAHWRHSGRPTVLMMFLAGGAMMVLEPFVDTAGSCWHPSNLARAFTLWDRPMPIWLCLTYFFYFGVGGGLTWLLLRKASTRGVLWGIFAAGV